MSDSIKLKEIKKWDKDGNLIYLENWKGYTRWKWDNGNLVYWETKDGWAKWEYDKEGNEIYWEDSDGCWIKKTYDWENNTYRHENSGGLDVVLPMNKSFFDLF